MPRTKRPVRRQEISTEQIESSKKLKDIITEEKDKLDHLFQMECQNMELAYKILLSTISKKHLQTPLGQLKTELYLNEVTNASMSTQNSYCTASHDDGYLTENSSQGSGGRSVQKSIAASVSSLSCGLGGRGGRRSRSAEPSTRRAPPPAATQRRRSRSVYRTPACKRTPHAYPAITPKVAPHAPLTVLRQPRQGEMVVSMSGSPVMVPTCYTMQPDEKANCNILLKDGTVLSLQPKHLRQSQAFIPFSLMDSNVLHQLKTLKDNLDKVVKVGEKVMK